MGEFDLEQRLIFPLKKVIFGGNGSAHLVKFGAVAYRGDEVKLTLADFADLNLITTA